jgi:hypothetical protein
MRVLQSLVIMMMMMIIHKSKLLLSNAEESLKPRSAFSTR